MHPADQPAFVRRNVCVAHLLADPLPRHQSHQEKPQELNLRAQPGKLQYISCYDIPVLRSTLCLPAIGPERYPVLPVCLFVCFYLFTCLSVFTCSPRSWGLMCDDCGAVQSMQCSGCGGDRGWTRSVGKAIVSIASASLTRRKCITHGNRVAS